MLDYFTFRELLRELGGKVSGSWIRKVTQPHPMEVAFHLSRGDALVISLGSPWAHFRLEEKPGNLFISPFLLLARKYLKGEKILSIEEAPGQKIAVFSTRESRMVVELPGIKNRMILLDEKGRILGSLGAASPLAGGLYQFPDPPNPHLFLSAEEDLRRAWPELYQGGSRSWWGLSALHWRVLRKRSPDASLELMLRARAGKGAKPCFVSGEKGLEGISLFDAPGENCVLAGSTVLAEVSRFYGTTVHKLAVDARRKRFLAAVARNLENRRAKWRDKEKMIKESDRLERLKTAGDLILTYKHQISRGEKELRVPDSGDIVQLDPLLNPAQNAQDYYRRYKKGKQGTVMAKSEMGRLKRTIAELEELETWIVLAEDDAHLSALLPRCELLHLFVEEKEKKKREGKIPKLLEVRENGYLFLAGRNMSENMEVLHRAKKDDWWFHAEGIPGGHVVIRSDEAEIPGPVMQKGADLAAYYSGGRAWDKVPVVCARRKDLRSVPGKKGSVIFESHRVMTGEPKPP